MLQRLDAAGDGAGEPIDVAALADVVAHAPRPLWLDACAPSEDEVAALAEVLGWHPLLAEDVLHRGQRQKAESFGKVLLLVLEEPPEDGTTDGRELLLVTGEGWLVTAHEGSRCVGQAARRWAHRSDIERNGAMAIVAELLGAVVDLHAVSADGYEEVVEASERRIVEEDDAQTLELLRAAARLRGGIARQRRRVGQLREVLGGVVRRELVETARSSELDLELRDVYDHLLRTHDDLDLLHERMTALADTRLALVAYRQNEITKRLSAWAAILLVPTIVTGWFGQNFHHLVGLSWRFGELYALGVILAVCAALVVVFRRAGWL